MVVINGGGFAQNYRSACLVFLTSRIIQCGPVYSVPYLRLILYPETSNPGK